MDSIIAYLSGIFTFSAETERFLIGFGISFAVILVATHAAMTRNQSLGESLKSLFANSGFYLLNLFFGPLAGLAAYGVREGITAANLPTLDPAFWEPVPFVLMIVVALFLFDFANYWCHRAMHVSAWLWPVHAIHHSDPAVNGLTTYRVHVLEAVIMLSAYAATMTLFGIDKEVIAIAGFLIGVHNIYVHFDIDWGHGPLKYVIASPRFHRWHHADVPEAHGKNLANFFPFLDLAFGTYYLPHRCEERMGAEGVPENDIIQLFLYPFVAWARLTRATIDRRLAKMLRTRASR